MGPPGIAVQGSRDVLEVEAIEIASSGVLHLEGCSCPRRCTCY